MQNEPQEIQLKGITQSFGGEYKSIRTEQLINSLNRVNFQDGSITVNFKHPKYDQIVSLHAKPQLCLNSELDCQWLENSGYSEELSGYQFLNFSLTDGLRRILVGAEVKRVGASGITFHLPEKGYDISHRRNARYSVHDVAAQLIQDGMVFRGALTEFSAISFKIDVLCDPRQSFQWLNSDYGIYAIFEKKGEALYSGLCEIIRQSGGHQERSLVLRPLVNNVHRFKPKQKRSIRQHLTPQPGIGFKHPFTDKTVHLNVVNLSGTGLAVEEDSYHSVLLPGMIIPRLKIEFMSAFSLQCKAQVVYRRVRDDASVLCGLAILDMDARDHITLSSLLFKAEENNSFFGATSIDMDTLWDFFFETGFVYPKKYAYIESEKERFKSLYEKLYSENPDIARHVIYQDKGTIYGHVSMLRCYEKAWIIHHHAAITTLRNKAGVVVIRQLGRFTNEFHRLRSSNMHYVFCYYRPENRFPDRVFGGVARNLNDPKGCSLDPFAYYYFVKSDHPTPEERLETGETILEPSSAHDLRELENFYEFHSGGLLTKALDLSPCMVAHDSEIDKEYNRLGFKRERRFYSLRKGKELLAVFVVLVSDIGLNMSELTNSIHVVVLDSEETSPQDIETALARLTLDHYEVDEVPVLLYPREYADQQQLPYEKVYNLWVLNLEYLDFYFQHIDTMLNRDKRKQQKQLVNAVADNA